MADGWWMYAKYDGRCAECNSEIEAGDRIGWVPLQKAALCKECAPEYIGEDPEE